MSHVTGAGVTHHGGAVRGVLIDGDNSGGADTGVVTCNMVTCHNIRHVYVS